MTDDRSMQIDTAAALLPSGFNGHPVYSPPEAAPQQVKF